MKTNPTDVLRGGDFSIVHGGHGSTVQGGDQSTVHGGDRSTLQGGDRSALYGGDGSKFKAGERSSFIGSYWKYGRKEVIKVYVGERGIKANTWYRFENGVFTEIVDN